MSIKTELICKEEKDFEIRGRYLQTTKRERSSYILQVTIGCAHNKCTFCSSFKAKKFRIRSLDEVFEDLAMARLDFVLQTHRKDISRRRRRARM